MTEPERTAARVSPGEMARIDDSPEVDRHGMEVLGREECLRLLASMPVGRVGLHMNALPVVLPVNYALSTPPWDDEPVVIVRSSAGAKLTSAMEHAVIALEADSYDRMAHAGWSVLVQGLTRVLTDPNEVAWAAGLPLEPWAVTDTDSYILLDTDVVRGRRFGAA